LETSLRYVRLSLACAAIGIRASTLLLRPCKLETAGAEYKHEYSFGFSGAAPHGPLISFLSNGAQVTRVLPKSAKKNTIMAYRKMHFRIRGILFAHLEPGRGVAADFAGACLVEDR
jgi:hypothetical protein